MSNGPAALVLQLLRAFSKFSNTNKRQYFRKNDWISNGKSLIVGYDVSHPTGEMREDRIDKKPPTQASIVGVLYLFK